MNNEKIAGSLSGFIEKKRRLIFLCIVIIVIACLAFVVAMLILESRNKKAIQILDETLLPRYEKLISVDTGGQAPGDNSENSDTMELYIRDLGKFAAQYSAYPAAKAWSVLAGIYSERLDWEGAENAYRKSAETGKESYLAPISYFNAAVAAEERGNIDNAIEYYVKAAAYPDFPQGAHAEFSRGRLYEQQNKIDSAKEAYQNVIDKWKNNESWMPIAQSRLIALEIAVPPVDEAAEPQGELLPAGDN
ncbi:MAG: tetratricopeptide repeat protein [Spirochaetaceae bacterium]|jgi:tetratricopeptide (TPR) repeat protein|nr:tetratricopeptide repeat protein [Spirochaetaceae bacterium]